jgi:cation diffusion facilitator family transporter
MQHNSSVEWSHSHNFGVDSRQSESKVRIVFWLTTVIMILEIAVGSWSGSMALLADGWHMGTHSAAFAITLFAYWYAKKHASDRAFNFGTGKVNYLGGFASAIALAIVALMMVVESVQRLLTPHAIHFDEAIVVAIIGLTANIISVFVLHDHHHHHHNEHHAHDHSHHHDHNIKAAYFHVLADTLTSVLAIVALLVGKYFGWIFMDPLMGIVGAIVISVWAYGLIKDTSMVLLDKSESTENLNKIIQAINEQNEKDGSETIVTDFHFWQVSAKHQAAILSISTKSTLEPDDYKLLLKQCLPLLSHITIEINKA